MTSRFDLRIRSIDDVHDVDAVRFHEVDVPRLLAVNGELAARTLRSSGLESIVISVDDHDFTWDLDDAGALRVRTGDHGRARAELSQAWFSDLVGEHHDGVAFIEFEVGCHGDDLHRGDLAGVERELELRGPNGVRSNRPTEHDGQTVDILSGSSALGERRDLDARSESEAAAIGTRWSAALGALERRIPRASGIDGRLLVVIRCADDPVESEPGRQDLRLGVPVVGIDESTVVQSVGTGIHGRLDHDEQTHAADHEHDHDREDGSKEELADSDHRVMVLSPSISAVREVAATMIQDSCGRPSNTKGSADDLLHDLVRSAVDPSHSCVGVGA